MEDNFINSSLEDENANSTSDLLYYNSGDWIGGKYVVEKLIGKGGFGLVYLIYDFRAEEHYAFKTFLDSFLPNAEARQSFRKEALLWVKLNKHPFILHAHCVHNLSERLFVQMDYIEPDERGRVTLADHLNLSEGPLDIKLTLEWSIQFCHGMEHAAKQNMIAHRDIKPTNILINKENQVQIADFGLAAAADAAFRLGSTKLPEETQGHSFNIFHNENQPICGTPGYMPPEIFEGKQATCRSDIYSFGLVLWQMAMGSSSPLFQPPKKCSSIWEYQSLVYQEQIKNKALRIKSPLQEIINKCLQVEPMNRFKDSSSMRDALESLRQNSINKIERIPFATERTADTLYREGTSLSALGYYNEALVCFDQALSIEPGYKGALINKGLVLNDLGRYEDALNCFNEVLKINPYEAKAWDNKGNSLVSLKQLEEAISCYDKALSIDPLDPITHNNKGYNLFLLENYGQAIECFNSSLAIDEKNIMSLYNKGRSLSKLGQDEEAVKCYDEALEIDPLALYVLFEKGYSLNNMGCFEEAIHCYEQILSIEPQSELAWNLKGCGLHSIDRTNESILCFDQALTINPEYRDALYNKGIGLNALNDFLGSLLCFDRLLLIDPQDIAALYNKAKNLTELNNYEDALRCYDQLLSINSNNHSFWFGKGCVYYDLNNYVDALTCFDKAILIYPDYESAWINKAITEDKLGNMGRAANAYKKFINIAGSDYQEYINYSKRRLQEID